jgi:antitoxin VapB
MPRSSPRTSKPRPKTASQTTEAKVFMSGRSQAVRLPLEFRFSGKSVYIKRLGDAIVLLPKSEDPLEAAFAALDKFPRNFKFVRNQRQSVRRGLVDLFAKREK